MRGRERTQATNVTSLNTPEWIELVGEEINAQKKKLLFGNGFKTESIRKLYE